MLGFSPIAAAPLGATEIEAAPNGVTGSLVASESGDSAAISADVATAGTVAATETSDTAVVLGEIVTQGDLLAAENGDDADLVGDIETVAAIAALENSDSATISGAIASVGDLAAAEGSDSSAISGGVDASGTLGTTDGTDSAEFIADLRSSGPLATIEGGDTAEFSGNVIWLPVNGTLETTEASDRPEITGTVIPFPAEAVMAATEADDSAQITGSVLSRGKRGGKGGFGGSIPATIEESRRGGSPSIVVPYKGGIYTYNPDRDTDKVLIKLEFRIGDGEIIRETQLLDRKHGSVEIGAFSTQPIDPCPSSVTVAVGAIHLAEQPRTPAAVSVDIIAERVSPSAQAIFDEITPEPAAPTLIIPEEVFDAIPVGLGKGATIDEQIHDLLAIAARLGFDEASSLILDAIEEKINNRHQRQQRRS